MTNDIVNYQWTRIPSSQSPEKILGRGTKNYRGPTTGAERRRVSLQSKFWQIWPQSRSISHVVVLIVSLDAQSTKEALPLRSLMYKAQRIILGPHRGRKSSLHAGLCQRLRYTRKKHTGEMLLWTTRGSRKFHEFRSPLCAANFHFNPFPPANFFSACLFLCCVLYANGGTHKSLRMP